MTMDGIALSGAETILLRARGGPGLVTAPQIGVSFSIAPKTGPPLTKAFFLTTTNDRVLQVFDSKSDAGGGVLPSGLLQAASIGIFSGSVPSEPGQLWVEVTINRGSYPIHRFYGYEYQRRSLTLWSRDSPFDGHGTFRVVTGADPAAQTSPSDTVPTNARWRLIAYQVELVGIAADTAAPRLVVETPTRVRKFLGGLQDAIAGAETQTFVWGLGNDGYGAGAPSAIVDTEVISPRLEIPPGLYMVGGDIVRVVTFGTFGATSNYGAPSITVEEWLGP